MATIVFEEVEYCYNVNDNDNKKQCIINIENKTNNTKGARLFNINLDNDNHQNNKGNVVTLKDQLNKYIKSLNGKSIDLDCDPDKKVCTIRNDLINFLG